MNRDRFVQQRQTDWRQLELLLQRLRSTRVGGWHSRDVQELARLYRAVCYDLSLVQSHEWGVRLEQYLNDLVAHGHNCLYRSPPPSFSPLFRFLGAGFPQLLRQYRFQFLLSLMLFAVPLMMAMAVGCQRPDLAELVAGQEILQGALSDFGTPGEHSVDARFAAQRSFMAAFYTNHNVGIAFRVYALGIFFGLGSAWMLVSNGISIGIVAGFLLAQGTPTALRFVSFVLPHSAFELTALVIAGTAGLVLGTSVIVPAGRSRMDSLQYHGLLSVQLALGAGMLLLLAAVIEAFLSPLPLHPAIGITAGVCMWSLMIAYLSPVVRPAAVIRKSPAERTDT